MEVKNDDALGKQRYRRGISRMRPRKAPGGFSSSLHVKGDQKTVEARGEMHRGQIAKENPKNEKVVNPKNK